MRIYYDEACAGYEMPGHPERPERVLAAARAIRDGHPAWEWAVPAAASQEVVLRAHSADHFERVGEPFDFDADTPAFPGIRERALQSAGAAVQVAGDALHGRRSFALMRPPGHHATRDQAMGFCYFNNVAIAAFDVLSSGRARKVAIWDFDAHHGNGTESICAGDDRILYVSVHQFPCYPGTGRASFANIRNHPVPPDTPAAGHRAILARSWSDVVGASPDLVLVSAGFDAYVRDPITQLCLEAADFGALGQWIRESGLPAGAILEGGYSPDLPGLILAFLEAWEG